MNLGLTGRKAIVAGGSRGIGKAIASSLAREGVDVALVARSAADLDAAARELAEESGREVFGLAADVTSRAVVERVVDEAVARLGGLHVLVNSASLPGGSPGAIGAIDTVVDEELLADFDVKYLGALRLSRAAIPHLKAARWGRIINVSGTNARRAGNLSGGARNVSLVHLTRTLAMQLGRHGVTVNCIHPGVTRTERTAGLLAERARTLGVSADEVERRDYAEGAPRANSIGRMVDAAEVAEVAVFLASRAASALNGELLVANGGEGSSVYY